MKFFIRHAEFISASMQFFVEILKQVQDDAKKFTAIAHFSLLIANWKCGKSVFLGVSLTANLYGKQKLFLLPIIFITALPQRLPGQLLLLFPPQLLLSLDRL